MKKFILACILYVPYINSFGQALNTGDKFPEEYFDKLTRESNLQSENFLKDKYVILDFWSINCLSCIKAFPKLDSLQKEFNKSIQIFLITTNNEKQCKDLFTKLKLARPDLPFIYSDSIFEKIFPHNFVPHYVIISKNKTVEAITYAYNIDRVTIGELIKGEKLDLETKAELFDFDMEQPLWTEGNGRLNSHLQYYSYIMGFVPGIGSISSFPHDSISKGLKFSNSPILSLYKIAYDKGIIGGFENGTRVILIGDEAKKLQMPIEPLAIKEWRKENLYCYELMIPKMHPLDVYTIMQQDLSRFFGFNACVEKRNVSCLTLIRVSDDDKLVTKGNKSIIVANRDSLKINNRTIQESLLPWLEQNNLALRVPFIDATGYKKRIDLEIAGPFNDIGKMKKELLKYGLDLVERIQEIEMLIIEKK